MLPSKRDDGIEQIAERNVVEGKSRRGKAPRKEEQVVVPVLRKNPMSQRRNTEREVRRESIEYKTRETVKLIRKQYDANMF